ncbi:MAG: 50S ribosomal protein L7ae [Clostridia bacterium]
MSENKLRSAIGFAMRSGNCISGDFVCERAVKAKKAKLLVLDELASESTAARYRGYCERAGIPCLTMQDMGHAIGKDGRMVAVITGDGFARMILEANANTDGGVD